MLIGMSTKLTIASVAFTTWMMVITAFMLLIRTFDLAIFFVLTLIGLLIVVILIDTSSMQPKYLRRMNYLLVAAFLVFSYVVIDRIVGVIVP